MRKFKPNSGQRLWIASATKRRMRRARRRGAPISWKEARARATDDCAVLGVL